ncbi:aminotransferase class I/II-fold pyridoxal phosphate-dependent enzyme [Mangrovicoccus ximenensis]|uniref:aminotransferase class I/II-fold pyridoxal phosphate-dependent enzyme n=1 Tax=Mangrovicoccus ximenensis TaxID=1911570 RepID=UPI00137505B5|nr:aminotransferase class I/II-fold pyridoxal phosphate-dependent enzyme [Mangrovicoccus ximenensis]
MRIAFEGGFRDAALDLSGADVMTEARALRGFGAVSQMRRNLARRDGFLRGTGDPLGDAAFHCVLHDYLMPDPLLDKPRCAAASTAAGHGALFMALRMLRRLNPETTIWLPGPGRGWQADMVRRTGLNLRSYPYSDGRTLLLGEMLAVLEAAAPGDVLLLQACGHDPTGIDLPHEAWGALTALCIETGAVPYVDLSHAGLSAEPAKDTDGPGGLMLAVPEAFLAISCSRSFALHADRTGMLVVQAETPDEASRARDMMAGLNADMLGAPPRSGGLIVTGVLFGSELRTSWEAELRQLRMQLGETRAKLAEALAASTGEAHWEALASQAGSARRIPSPRRRAVIPSAAAACPARQPASPAIRGTLSAADRRSKPDGTGTMPTGTGRNFARSDPPRQPENGSETQGGGCKRAVPPEAAFGPDEDPMEHADGSGGLKPPFSRPATPAAAKARSCP